MSRQDRFGWFALKQHWQRLTKPSRASGGLLARRLHAEKLEDRRMLAVVTVDTNLDVVDFNDGVTSLREALFATNLIAGADEIRFDFDSPTTILLTEGELTITDDLTITGLGAELLTIDAGNGTDNLFGTGDGFRVFNIDNRSFSNQIDVELVGLTLTGGDVSGLGFSGNGGAVLSQENLTITSSTITENSAGLRGGGIFASDSITTITSSTISDNSAGEDGGGIYARFSMTLTVISSTIIRNTAGDIGEPPTGGGEGSSVGNNGGGIFALFGVTTISSSTISDNSAGDNGAGVFTASGTIVITSSTINGNSAGARGGGIFADSGTRVITSSTISGNSADGNGGGIFNVGGTTRITSSTIALNRADADNNGSGSGGGIGISSFGSADMTLNHTLVAGNDLGDATKDDISGSIQRRSFFEDSEFNLIGVDTGLSGISDGTDGNRIGTSAAPLDPLLGPLADNGGPTLTHALLAGSPAIDAGDPTFGPRPFTPPLDFDQRGSGFDRVRDGNSDATAVIDIGAFELPPPSADFDNDNNIDGADFLAWQRGFGSPTPAKSDGDADTDGDVDGTDLSFWETQFGGPAPLAAVSTASALTSTSAEEPSSPLESVAMIAQPLVTTITRTSAELASVAQIVGHRGSDSNRAPLLRVNRFEVVDRAFGTPSLDKVRDDFDSLAHAQRDSIRTVVHHVQRSVDAQAADDLFAALAEEERFAELRALLKQL